MSKSSEVLYVKSDASQEQKTYERPWSQPLVALISLILGVGSSLGLGIGGFYLMGDSWMSFNEVTGTYYTMTTAALIGVYMVIMSIALGPTLLGHSLLSIARLRSHTRSFLPAFLTTVIAAGVVAGVILSGIYLIDAFSPYIWYQGQDAVPLLNTLNQLLGCLLVSVYTLFSVAALLMAADSLNLLPIEKPHSPMFIKALQPNNSIATSFNGLNFLILSLSFSFIFVLTLFLPHVWAITNMSVIAWNAYFVNDSPFSLIHDVILYQSENLHFTYQNITTMNTTLPTSPLNTTTNSTMMITTNITTLEYLPDPDYLQPTIFLKLYETVVVYYSVIFLIVATGIIGSYYAPLRRYFHKRINMNFIPKIINLWPVGASIGELALTATVVALHCYWFWYWAFGWGYRPITVMEFDRQDGLETYARVMGEMAVLTMSFLTFPVAHNSVWESVFGVPFDRAIKYHRTLGALFWTFTTCHMLLFQAKWLRRGVLATNAWLEPNNWIVEGSNDNPLIFRNSNWTIPLMEITWLLSTVALSAALLRTTYKYELFVYTHFFMAMFLILAFMHSFQSWYYTAAGLLLYGFDKIIRILNASRQHTMTSLKFHEDSGVTRINLPGGIFPNIKSLKPGSWTYRLGEFAQSISSSGIPASAALMDIAMDGPYGRSADYSNHKTVVLVAGGIGVTPMMSIFGELTSRMGDALKLKTSGVFVHLFITGHKGFPVLSVEEILENMRRKKMTDDATQMKPDPHRSVLNADTFYGADELHFNSIKMKDCTSAPVYTSSPSLGITMHNMLEATIASHVTQMENEIGREDNSSSPSQTTSLNPINVSIDQLLSGMLPISKFSVTFGRPDYENLFNLIDGKMFYPSTGSPFCSKPGATPDGTSLDITDIEQNYINNYKFYPDVACLVCAPGPAVDCVSQQCYKKNWMFQAEEFTI